MNITIIPSSVQGFIGVPPSKSASQRALCIAYIRKAITILWGVGKSKDEQAVIGVLKATGCNIEHLDDGSLLIDSSNIIDSDVKVSVGESGLAARMLTPVLALRNAQTVVLAEGSLLVRPMHVLYDVLSSLGVLISPIGKAGFLPATISSRLQPQSITVDGSISSQFITGLLLAYSAANADDVTITVANPVSKPYIALTLKVMQDMAMPVPSYDSQFTKFSFSRHTSTTPKTIEYKVEGDWSNAAFLLVAGAIAGNLVITGLDVFTEQGDKAVLQPLMDAGVRMSITTESITVQEASLTAFHYNATETPDLFPPLVVLAAYCSGTSVIEGVHRLVHKESNRAVVLQEVMAKLGVEILFQDDMMLIKGGMEVKGGVVNAHNDHRIAMACAIAALKADAPVIIEGAEAVEKSWPNFFEQIATLGVQIQ